MFIIRILGLYNDDLRRGAAPHIAEILHIDPRLALRAANGDELSGSAEDVAQLLTLLPVHVKHITIQAKHQTDLPPIGLASARELTTYRRALDDARDCTSKLRTRLAATALVREQVMAVHGD